MSLAESTEGSKQIGGPRNQTMTHVQTAVHDTPFAGYLMGGFECSTHRRRDGRRLDLLEATGHDRAAEQDYRTLLDHGIRTVRDGVRWHRIEPSPGRYDWSSVLPMLRAARSTGIQVVWDLCHYGWPDDIDIWRPGFVDRFAAFAARVARLIRGETDGPLFVCPVNEISYWAWAAGDMAQFHPLGRGRGFELKHQLVRASIAAIEAVWSVDPRARIVHAEPAIHVCAPGRPRKRAAAERLRLTQYEAWDMLSGRAWPGLGGRPEYLDVVGINYYSDNQWAVGGPTIAPGEPHYRPLRHILHEIWRRYQRPMLITETGAESDARVPWLRYVAQEVHHALGAGVPVQGICLYPILDYPGWTNGRHCPTGLFGSLEENGRRRLYQPLADEIAWQNACFDSFVGRSTDSDLGAVA